MTQGVMPATEVEAVVEAEVEAGAAVAAAEAGTGAGAEAVHDASALQNSLRYERTEEDLQYRGTVHLVIGHGGASLSMNQQQPPPTFLVNSHDTWGYLRLHISRTVLHGEVVSDSDGGLMDELRLTKAEDWGQRYMAARRVQTQSGAAAAVCEICRMNSPGHTLQRAWGAGRKLGVSSDYRG